MVSRVVAMLVLGRSDLARERVTNLSLSLLPEDTAGLTALRGAAYAPRALWPTLKGVLRRAGWVYDWGWGGVQSGGHWGVEKMPWGIPKAVEDGLAGVPRTQLWAPHEARFQAVQPGQSLPVLEESCRCGAACGERGHDVLQSPYFNNSEGLQKSCFKRQLEGKTWNTSSDPFPAFFQELLSCITAAGCASMPQTQIQDFLGQRSCVSHLCASGALGKMLQDCLNAPTRGHPCLEQKGSHVTTWESPFPTRSLSRLISLECGFPDSST
jgi:hypothetical protein